MAKAISSFILALFLSLTACSGAKDDNTADDTPSAAQPITMNAPVAGVPWYEQKTLPADFNTVMVEERRFHGADNHQFKKMADAETCGVMESVGLSCDYITRGALAMFLAMNGKDPIPPSAGTNPYCADLPDKAPHNCFTGRPAQNRLIREAILRNKGLFRKGNLEAKDIARWR